MLKRWPACKRRGLARLEPRHRAVLAVPTDLDGRALGLEPGALAPGLEPLFHHRIGKLINPAAALADSEGGKPGVVLMRMGAGNDALRLSSRWARPFSTSLSSAR